VRVSRIVAALQKPGWGDKKPLLDALLEGRRAVDTSAPDRGTALPVPDARNGAAIAADPARPVASAPAALRERATVIHVHGNATFYMGSGASSEAAADRDEGAAALEKQLRFDPDYAQREGYQRDFLGVEIALPGIVAARKPEMLKGPGNRVLVLRYHHYSLAMNQDRRFQMWSAVNVDYSAGARVHAQKREAFGTDHWVLDPRIPGASRCRTPSSTSPRRGSTAATSCGATTAAGAARSRRPSTRTRTRSTGRTARRSTSASTSRSRPACGAGSRT
jgi:endonuclease G